MENFALEESENSGGTLSCNAYGPEAEAALNEYIDSHMFRANFRESEYDRLFYAKENGKFQLDLWKANELVLTDAGIRPEHLAVTNVCTCCNPELLFSHRASKGKRGNLAAFIALKEG